VTVNIAALIFACSVHADDALLLSLAYVHGRGNPYSVLDVQRRGPEEDEAGDMLASSSSAARAAVERILAAGGEPVLGLLPARPDWALEFGKTLEDLFDPCGNIEIASAKLSEFDYACRDRGSLRSSQRRSCTLDRYGESLGLPALGRAVLCDLTMPSAFPSPQLEMNESMRLERALGGNSGLFFATRPLEPALSPSDTIAPAPRPSGTSNNP
jgi:hypothetical protein